MGLLSWADLPNDMRVDEVRPYYDELAGHRMGLFAKRIFDILCSLFLFALTWWLFIILAVAIKLDSPGPVFSAKKELGDTARRFVFSSSEPCASMPRKRAHKSPVLVTLV